MKGCVLLTILFVCVMWNEFAKADVQVQGVLPPICSSTTCKRRKECRLVVNSQSNEFEEKCVKKPVPVSDSVCVNAGYLTTLLSKEAKKKYSALGCSTKNCPGGSACTGPSDNRVCCTGKPGPGSRPGYCPPVKQGEFSICPVTCSKDSECEAADEKCCKNSCGGHVCQKSVADQCGGCPKDRVCVDAGIRCVTEPCDAAFACKKKCKGKCQQGQECVKGECNEPPCLSWCQDLCGPDCTNGGICWGKDDCQQCAYRCGPDQKCAFIASECDGKGRCKTYKAGCVSVDLDIECARCRKKERCMLTEPDCLPNQRCKLTPRCVRIKRQNE